MPDDLSEGHPAASDEARALIGKSLGDIVYDIIAGSVQLAGTVRGTSSTTGTLTVARAHTLTAAQETSAAIALNVIHRQAVLQSAFVPSRELSAGEWAGLAVLVEGIAEIAVRDHGVTATQALGVRIIAFVVLAALISRFPRSI